jgi:hypothetical protein
MGDTNSDIDMWQIHHLVVENIGPFRGRHEFSLGTGRKGGLVLITGKGAPGKSYLFRVLCWLLSLNQNSPALRLTERDINFEARLDGLNSVSATVILEIRGKYFERTGTNGSHPSPLDVDELPICLTDLNYGAVVSRKHPPLLIEDLIDRLGVVQLKQVAHSLSSYPGQVILFAGHVSDTFQEIYDSLSEHPVKKIQLPGN